MTHSLFSLFILNVFVNSLLTFVTVSLIMFFFIWLFRIKDSRLKMMALVIPLIKLPLDLFCYHFSNWALAQGVNPLEAPEGSRVIALSMPIYPFSYYPLGFHALLSMNDGRTFTFADMLALWLGAPLTHLIAHVFLFCFAIALFIACRKLWYSWVEIKHVYAMSSRYYRPIFNLALAQNVNKRRVDIRISPYIQTPFATCWGKSMIVFPEQLSESLTQEEFEAVIAHEIEHLRWGDPFLKSFLFLISRLFWWVPTEWVKKKLELEQEFACDKNSIRYAIQPMALAEAIFKASRSPFQLNHLVSNFSGKRNEIKRLKALLAIKQERKFKVVIQSLFVLIVMVGLLFGQIWTF